jgi:hypothetical protein
MILLLAMLQTAVSATASATAVTWTTRGAWSAHAALGSMPIGTGRTGANVWVDDDGLRVLISATDSYSEYSQLMKIGMVQVLLDPNPFAQLPRPPPTPGPTPPPFPGNRSALGSFVETKSTIGCASASGCTDPKDPTLFREFSCSSAADCPAEAAAACGRWAACTSFSHASVRPVTAQLFACARATTNAQWNTWKLKNSTCSPPPPRAYPKFEQTLDVDRNLLTITSGDVKLELFADWNSDVIRGRVTSTSAASAASAASSSGKALPEFKATIVQRSWRNVTVADCIPGNPRYPACAPGEVCAGEHGLPPAVVTTPDTFVGGYDKRGDLLWYRRNPAYTAVDASMKQQVWI